MNSSVNERAATPTLRGVTAWVLQRLRARDVTIHLALVLVFVPSIIHAQVALDVPFLQALEENGLTFRETALKEYTTTTITKNPHMNYELAVRSKKLPLEIRYAIRRYDPSPREPSVRPEAAASALFMAVLLNIGMATNPKDPASAILNSVEFDAKAVQKDFNAEWGASALVIPKKEFAGGFDRCMAVYIYRKRVSAYMFYMFKSQATQPALDEVEKVFTTLRFR